MSYPQRRPQTRVVVGTRAAIEALHRGDQEVVIEYGRLRDGRPAMRVTLPGGRPRVLDVMPIRRPPPAAGWRTWPAGAWAAITVVVLAVLGVVGWAVWSLLAWAAHHALALAAVAAVLVLLSTGGACTVVVKVTHRH